MATEKEERSVASSETHYRVTDLSFARKEVLNSGRGTRDRGMLCKVSRSVGNVPTTVFATPLSSSTAQLLSLEDPRAWAIAASYLCEHAVHAGTSFLLQQALLTHLPVETPWAVLP